MSVDRKDFGEPDFILMDGKGKVFICEMKTGADAPKDVNRQMEFYAAAFAMLDKEARK